jgi:spermidine/putrescine-binding protein
MMSNRQDVKKHQVKIPYFFSLAVLGVLAVCLSCGKKDSKADRQFNLYIWSAYISDDTLKKFEKQSGIQVRYDTYDSNEALLEKLQSGVSEYDVVVPSDYMARILIHQNLLSPLDHSKLTGLDNLTPRFRNMPYDQKNAHTVPFLWGTSGIGYNKTKVTDPVDSWSILWNPKYKDRILMLDDLREVFAVALKLKRHSINTTNPTELTEAKDLLIQQKPLVKTYNSASFDEILLSGDVWLAHGWSGQLAKAADQNKDLAYVVPKEGSVMWVDNMAIPKDAKHIEEAYEFMRFCLTPEIAGEITNFSGYPSPNEAAKKFIRPDILKDPARYPDDKTLASCEFIQDLGETSTLLDRYWTEVKSR